MERSWFLSFSPLSQKGRRSREKVRLGPRSMGYIVSATSNFQPSSTIFIAAYIKRHRNVEFSFTSQSRRVLYCYPELQEFSSIDTGEELGVVGSSRYVKHRLIITFKRFKITPSQKNALRIVQQDPFRKFRYFR
jgi:hypothetical protein